MLKVVSQTNLDTIIFIGDDEPTYKITGLILGLFKKGFCCEGRGATTTTFMMDQDGNSINGIRVRFSKITSTVSQSYRRFSAQRSYFKRQITNSSGTTFILDITKGINFRDKATISINATPSEEEQRKLFVNNILSKYSRHIKCTNDLIKLPPIISTADINDSDLLTASKESILDEKEKEMSKIRLDTIVTRVQNLEENYQYLYPVLSMRVLSGREDMTKQPISLAEFDKFSKQIDVIKEVSIPSNDARNKLIELCNIFSKNNVLQKLKANNFEFVKISDDLIINFFGIPIIREHDFRVFKYFDHPGINFCADYLDKTKTFDIIEAKISKEIITRI